MTGLGFLTWRRNGRSLQLDGQAAQLATFNANHDIQNTYRQEGVFEIYAQGLRQDQLDEIVVTGLAELERRRKSAEDEEAGFYGALAGAVGGAS